MTHAADDYKEIRDNMRALRVVELCIKAGITDASAFVPESILKSAGYTRNIRYA